MRRKGIIGPVQFVLGDGKLSIGTVFHLHIEQVLGQVPKFNHPQHPLGCRGRQFHEIHPGVFTVIHAAVHIGEAEILHLRVCRYRRIHALQLGFIQFRLGDRPLNVGDSRLQLVSQHSALDGFYRCLLFAVLGVFR